MRKYKIITRANLRPIKSEYWEDTPFLPHLTVYESEQGARDTGLLDHYGNSIFAIPESPQIGFIHHLVSSE